MNLLFEDESNHMLPFDKEKAAKDILLRTCSFLNIPFETQLSLLLTDSDGIRAINKEFRNIDAPTDVLSFPMNEYVIPEDFLDANRLAMDPDTEELLLGDIVISIEAVNAQAEEYGHSQIREYAFLIVHSVLHLVGYDHIEEMDRISMEARQKEIMTFLNINR